MNTRLDMARKEAERARANAERAKTAAQRAEQLLTATEHGPSGLIAMAVAAAQVAYRAASEASEAAADSLAVAEAQVTSSPAFESACRAVSSSLRAAIAAAQGAVAAQGVAATLSEGHAPVVGPTAQVAPVGHGTMQCTFCGTPESATRLAAGPGVFICSECVRQCQRILGLNEGGVD
jgi:hypothetical protein